MVRPDHPISSSLLIFSEIQAAVGLLHHVHKQSALLYADTFTAFVPQDGALRVQWNYSDGSLRFFDIERNKVYFASRLPGHADILQNLGIFEKLHTSRISAALFLDARTLITASHDSSLAIWHITRTATAVNLHLETNLFGHRCAISKIALSATLRTLVTMSVEGEVLYWDLNRREILCRFLCLGYPTVLTDDHDAYRVGPRSEYGKLMVSFDSLKGQLHG